MIVKSSERSTGMGANSFTAVLQDGKWLPVSKHPQARYLGRDHGWEQYELDTPDNAPVVADFYRSNSGKEQVNVNQRSQPTLIFGSFDEADRWAANQAVETIIVSRHMGEVTWLAGYGITGKVIVHATANDVRGHHVFGALPLHLACLADRVTVVDLPRLAPDKRGLELTPEQMDAAGATLTTYRVIVMEEK